VDEARALSELARRAVGLLEKEGVRPVLIGALALAAHGYARHTTDVDFGVSMHPREFARFAEHLAQTEGLHVDYDLADPSDPLGGVINLYLEAPVDDEVAAGDWDVATGYLPKVQIVNFDNAPAGGFPLLIQDTLARSRETSKIVQAPLPTLEDLILFKAYAGGPKSRNDVAELLTRTKPDIELLRARAEAYRMTQELEFVLDGLV
jgi:hypothetical protein